MATVPNRKVDRASVLYNMMMMFSICVFDGFGPFLVLVTWERWADLLLLLVMRRREEEIYQLLSLVRENHFAMMPR